MNTAVRIPLPRTQVNKGKKTQLRAAKPRPCF